MLPQHGEQTSLCLKALNVQREKEGELLYIIYRARLKQTFSVCFVLENLLWIKGSNKIQLVFSQSSWSFSANMAKKFEKGRKLFWHYKSGEGWWNRIQFKRSKVVFAPTCLTCLRCGGQSYGWNRCSGAAVPQWGHLELLGRGPLESSSGPTQQRILSGLCRDLWWSSNTHKKWMSLCFWEQPGLWKVHRFTFVVSVRSRFFLFALPLVLGQAEGGCDLGAQAYKELRRNVSENLRIGVKTIKMRLNVLWTYSQVSILQPPWLENMVWFSSVQFFSEKGLLI